MVKTEREYREDICQIGRLVFQKGWVAANDGNISIRLDAERILATPTGVCKGMMHVDDMIIVDMQGNKIAGRAQRTSEIAMHTTIYGMRPDIKAVVHAHPPVATGFAAAGRALNLALLPEVVIGLGCVPLADYGLEAKSSRGAGWPVAAEDIRAFCGGKQSGEEFFYVSGSEVNGLVDEGLKGRGLA